MPFIIADVAFFPRSFNSERAGYVFLAVMFISVLVAVYILFKNRGK